MGGGVTNLKWRLANDSLDKINKGEIIINANTRFNGDATIVSQGENEETIIKGGSITFTRGGQPITVIRNVQVGEIETNSQGKGILSFPKFKNMDLLLSIKSFNISQNVRSLGCYVNILNSAENKYQFFLYGKETGLSEGTEWESLKGNYSTQFSQNCISISTSSVHLFAKEFIFTKTRESPYDQTYPSISEVTSVPTVDIKVFLLVNSEMKLLKHIQNYKFQLKIVRQYLTPYYKKATDYSCYLDVDIPISTTNTVFNSTEQTIKIEVNFKTQTVDGRFNYTNVIEVFAIGTYSLEKLENLVGNGTLFYMAIEN